MEVDPEEVKRHLEILGYTHIEPGLLNEFIEGEYCKIIKNFSHLNQLSFYEDPKNILSHKNVNFQHTIRKSDRIRIATHCLKSLRLV